MTAGQPTGERVSLRDLGLGEGLNARLIAATGVMLAVVFVLTRFIQISIGAGGYIHLGDIAIYVAAFLFGPVVGLIAGGAGTALADISSGYSVWAPGSFIVHGLQAFVAAYIGWRSGLNRMVVAAIIGGAIVVGGYFVYMLAFAGPLDSDKDSALAFAASSTVWFNFLQVVIGAAVAIPVVIAVRKAYPPILRWGAEQSWVEE